jgi:GAF domain-containing protein
MISMISSPIGSRETGPEQYGHAFLSRATMALLSSLDFETTMHQVADVAVPALGDFCACIATTSDGCVQRATFAGVGLRQQAALPNEGQSWPLLEGADHPIVRVLRRGEPLFVPIVTDAWLQTVATGSDHLRFLRNLEPRSFIAVPLVAHDELVGALTTCHTSASGRRYEAEDLYLASEFGERVAQVIANARRYRDEEERRMRAEAERAALQHRLNAIVGRKVVDGIGRERASGAEITWVEDVQRPRRLRFTLAAHDIKNALSAMHMRAQLLARDALVSPGPEPSPLVEGLATIEAS